MTFLTEFLDPEQAKMFRSGLEVLFATHRTEASEKMLEGYLASLIDLTPDQFKAAIFRGLRESNGLPSPLELRSFAGAEVKEDTKAMQAWGDVQKAIPIGKWKWIDFVDQRINAVIRNLCSGGWPDFLERMDGGEKEKWARLEFMKAYTKIGDDLSAEQCRPLVGLGEKTCIGGQMRDPIVRIACSNPERQTAIEHRRAEPVTLNIATFRKVN